MTIDNNSTFQEKDEPNKVAMSKEQPSKETGEAYLNLADGEKNSGVNSSSSGMRENASGPSEQEGKFREDD